MPRSAGGVVVNFTAGTATFLKDTQAASGAVKLFGSQVGSSMGGARVAMTAATTSVRELEGNLGSATRGMARFLVDTLKLGPVLEAAFPVIGAVAFAGVLYKIGEGVVDFFKKMSEAPTKIKETFGEMTTSIRISADELEVSNDKLQNDIDKLLGKRENNLKLALDEAKVSADKLFESMENSIREIVKMQKELSISTLESLATNTKGTKADEVEIRTFQASMRRIDEETDAAVHAAKTKEDAEAAAEVGARRALKLIQDEKATYDKLIEPLQKIKDLQQRGATAPVGLSNRTSNYQGYSSQNVESLLEYRQGIADTLQQMSRQSRAEITHMGLTSQDEELKAGVPGEHRGEIIEAEVNKIIAETQKIKDAELAVGKPEWLQNIIQASGEAGIAIERLNKVLIDRHLGALTDIEKASITLDELNKQNTASEDVWARKIESSNSELRERIKSLDLMREALGRGAHAAIEAETAVKTLQFFPALAGPNAGGFMDTHGAEVANFQSQTRVELEKQYSNTIAQANLKLGEQISLENALVAVQRQGADAVRDAEYAYKIQTLVKKDNSLATLDQVYAESLLFNVQSQRTSGTEIEKLNLQDEALRRVTASVLLGANAERQAAVENEVAAAKLKAGFTPEIEAMIRRNAAEEYYQKLLKEAIKPGQEAQDALVELKARLAILESLKDSLAVRIAIRDTQNQILENESKQMLQLGGLRDGVHAFFLEMQESAKTSATIIYDSLNSAFSKLTDELSKAMTGQKTNWAKTFQELGGGIVKESLQSAAHTGLGAIAKHIPGLAGLAKNDGSSESMAFWVKVSGKYGQYASHPMGPLPLPGTTPQNPIGLPQSNGPLGLGSLSGSGGGGGIWGALGSILGALIPHAEGGPTYPGQAYLVGERGPEPFIPNMNGTILSNALAQRTFGGGGGTNVFHIDARGTDPVLVAQRTQMAVEHAQLNATRSALRNQHEQHLRTPQRG